MQFSVSFRCSSRLKFPVANRGPNWFHLRSTGAFAASLCPDHGRARWVGISFKGGSLAHILCLIIYFLILYPSDKAAWVARAGKRSLVRVRHKNRKAPGSTWFSPDWGIHPRWTYRTGIGNIFSYRDMFVMALLGQRFPARWAAVASFSSDSADRSHCGLAERSTESPATPLVRGGICNEEA